MKLLASFWCALVLSGCLSPSELRETADALREEWASRATTVEQEVDGFAGALDGLADELEARQAKTEEALDGLKEGGALGLVGSVMAAIYGTNRLRDRKRKARGENT